MISILFLLFCTLLSVFVLVSGILSTASLLQLGIIILFLPVPFYFVYVSIAFLLRKDRTQRPEVDIVQNHVEFLLSFGLILILIAIKLWKILVL